MNRFTGIASAYLSRRRAISSSHLQIRTFSGTDFFFERLENFDQKVIADTRERIKEQRHKVNQIHGRLLALPVKGGQMVERILVEQSLMHVLAELSKFEDRLNQVTAEPIEVSTNRD